MFKIKVNGRTDAQCTPGHDISPLAYGPWGSKTGNMAEGFYPLANICIDRVF